MTTAYHILRRPRITEKGTRMAASHPVVVFEVPVQANKVEIKKAVQSVFNVEVSSVRTLVVRGKTKRRGKFIGKRSNWKKAIVTLAAGQEIDFFGSAAV
jgi:large subunit ribosomal protein L23